MQFICDLIVIYCSQIRVKYLILIYNSLNLCLILLIDLIFFAQLIIFIEPANDTEEFISLRSLEAFFK